VYYTWRDEAYTSGCSNTLRDERERGLSPFSRSLSSLRELAPEV